MKDLYIDPEAARNDVLACAAFVAERVNSADGHADALKEIVPRYLRRNEVDLCAQMADALEDAFARDRLLADIAEHCARTNDDEYALQLADAAEDYSARSITRERLAAAKAEMHQFDKAVEIAESLDHRENAYAAIAFHTAAAGDTATAEKMVAEIEFPALRAKTYAEMAGNSLAHEQKELAEKYLNAAVQAAGEGAQQEEKLRELCDVANLWIRAGRKDRAIEITSAARDTAEVLEHRHWRDHWLSQIAQLYFRADSSELADRTLDMIEDKYFFALCLKHIAERKYAAGQTAEALEDLEEGWALLIAQKYNEIRDSHGRYDLLGGIAIDFAHYGEGERAIQAAQQIDLDNIRNRALQGIAGASILLENEPAADQAFRAIDEEAARTFALLGMSDAYRQNDNGAKALELLNEAHQLVEETPQLASRSTALNEIARRFGALGDTENARAVMLENLNTIRQILDSSVKATSLAAASDVYNALELPLTDAEKTVLGKMVVE
jgi:hypothetical protein